MIYSDLHIHSNYSDGKLSPEEIVDLSIKRGIKCISITDHDTIDSQYITDKNLYSNQIEVFSGLEISSRYNDIEIHILAYFIDIENERLKSTLDNIKNIRRERAKEIINKLNKVNVDIHIEDISEKDYNGTIGRLHIAKLLVKKGYAGNTRDAFQKYLIKGRPAFVDRYKINYKEALALINDAKGISVLAHPGEIYRNIILEKLLKDLKVYGLKGLEVFHPAHSSKGINDYYNFAKKYSLVITGGSDSHGSIVRGDYTLGTVGINEALTYKFIHCAGR